MLQTFHLLSGEKTYTDGGNSLKSSGVRTALRARGIRMDAIRIVEDEVRELIRRRGIDPAHQGGEVRRLVEAGAKPRPAAAIGVGGRPWTRRVL